MTHPKASGITTGCSASMLRFNLGDVCDGQGDLCRVETSDLRRFVFTVFTTCFPPPTLSAAINVILCTFAGGFSTLPYQCQ